MDSYEHFPRPRTPYDIEFLESLKYELEIALSTLDMQSGIDTLTRNEADYDNLEGEELDLAIEQLHAQVSKDPIDAGQIKIREAELLRLKNTVENLLKSA